MNDVPYQFGRYISVAEFILGRVDLLLATTQSKVQFVKTIRQINSSSAIKNKDKMNELLSAIVSTFPVEFPSRFSLSEQTNMMLGYYHQKEELYKSRI